MAQSPPFAIAETVPADDDFIRLYPGQERLFRDIVESWLSLEHDATTGRHKIPTDTAANLALNSYATGSIRYDTDDNTFQVSPNGTTWNIVSIVPGFQFLIRSAAATAPRGWTKVSLGANYAIVASDDATTTIDGGTTGFTSVFTSRTISQANLPSVNFSVSGTAASSGSHSHGGSTGIQTADHSHTFAASTTSDGNHTHTSSLGGNIVITGAGDNAGSVDIGDGSTDISTTGATSSAGSHNHTLSGTTSGISASHQHGISSDGAHTHTVSGNAASGGSGTAMDFSVLRLGHTLCTKASPS